MSKIYVATCSDLNGETHVTAFKNEEMAFDFIEKLVACEYYYNDEVYGMDIITKKEDMEAELKNLTEW